MVKKNVGLDLQHCSIIQYTNPLEVENRITTQGGRSSLPQMMKDIMGRRIFPCSIQALQISMILLFDLQVTLEAHSAILDFLDY